MYSNKDPTIYIVTLVGSVISLIFTTLILYFYLTKSNLKTYSHKYIRYLSFTDIFLSICKLYTAFTLPSFEENSWICVIQAILITYFLLSSILWTAALSHALHTVVTDNDPDFGLMERRYLVMAYGLPILAFFLPLVNNNIGPSEGWCWISSKDVGASVMRFICYYVPLLLVIIYNIVMYKKVMNEISSGSCVEGPVSHRLKFYPLILIITQFSMTLHRLIFFFFGVTWKPLAILGVLTTTLMGFANSLLYGFTEPVKMHMFKCLKRKVHDDIHSSLGSSENGSLVHTSLNR